MKKILSAVLIFSLAQWQYLYASPGDGQKSPGVVRAEPSLPMPEYNEFENIEIESKNEEIIPIEDIQIPSQFVAGAYVYAHNRSHLVGKVSRVFQNNNVEVGWLRIDGHAIDIQVNVWDGNKLSLETKCVNQICPRDTVYGDNGNDLVGTVERTFANGQVEILWETINGIKSSDSSFSYWSSDRLSKLVD